MKKFVTNEFYLMPYDSQKSFYKKARVEEYNDGEKILYSYDTPVCSIDRDGNFTRLWFGYSATTMKHVNAFLKCYGISGGGKKWWDAQGYDGATTYKVVVTTPFGGSRKQGPVFDDYGSAEEYAEKIRTRNPYFMGFVDVEEIA